MNLARKTQNLRRLQPAPRVLKVVVQILQVFEVSAKTWIKQKRSPSFSWVNPSALLENNSTCTT
jgi:hypothetical protein